MARLPFWSPDQVADYLVSGYWTDKGLDLGSGDRNTSAFPLGDDRIITVDMSALSTVEQRLARWGLDAWSDVTGIRFATTVEGAKIVFSNDAEGAFGGGGTIEHERQNGIVNIEADWVMKHGDLIGDYTSMTYIHEIGHALGLGHAGNYNVGQSGEYEKLYRNDSKAMSVMSYHEPEDQGFVAGEPVTPMLADIIAMRDLYGHVPLREGDDVYGVGGNVEGYMGLVMSAVTEGASTTASGQPVLFSIIDDGGHDRIDFSNDVQGQFVDLSPGSQSTVYGMVGAMTIAPGTIIEDYVAGSGNDVIYATSSSTRIDGGAGDDEIYGGAGADLLFSGSGRNLISGGAGRDTIHGGTGQDTLEGGDDSDWILAGSGGSLVAAGEGRNMLLGDDGHDIFVFTSSDASLGMQSSRILRFDEGDIIDLSEFTFSLASGGELTGEVGELVIRDNDGWSELLGDTDGDGQADFELVVGSSLESDAILV